MEVLMAETKSRILYILI
jgi:predicted DNA-binding transcriptional regulator YafY